MNKNLGIALAIVLAVVVIGGGYVLMTNRAQEPASVVTPSTPSSEIRVESGVNTEAEESVLPGQQPPSGERPKSPPTSETAGKTVVVTYTDSGYSPKSVTINKGDMVSFRNASSDLMWTASAAHPTHGVYPTTGGCIGSTFDSCVGIQPGATWSFVFDIVGKWNYHDHLDATRFGTVVVQ